MDRKKWALNRGLILVGTLLALVLGGLSLSSEILAKEQVVVYKSPSCGCCGGWVDHMEKNGYPVVVKNIDEMDQIKERLGVPDAMQSCHTAQVGGYLIEGHVPASDVDKLLSDRPKGAGLAAPGMPMGSPGMEVPGEVADKYDVLLFTKEGRARLFKRH
jgi:hypothetical protein